MSQDSESKPALAEGDIQRDTVMNFGVKETQDEKDVDQHEFGTYQPLKSDRKSPKNIESIGNEGSVHNEVLDKTNPFKKQVILSSKEEDAISF